LVRIRLRRMGTSKLAYYRIVAADSRKAQDGRFLENLGYYDPLRRPQEIRVDEARMFDWMKRGAQVSETVRSILRRTGSWARWHAMQAGDDVTPEVVFLKGSKRTAPESAGPDRN
jgi:small subunit ribosomal protein S16